MSNQPPVYVRRIRGEPQVRRWKEQRWLVDNIIARSKAAAEEVTMWRRCRTHMPCSRSDANRSFR